MKIKPAGKWVFIKVDEDEQKTESGFILDSANNEPKFCGQVITGDREGQRVVFNLYEGKPVTVQGEKMLVVSEDNIFGEVE